MTQSIKESELDTSEYTLSFESDSTNNKSDTIEDNSDDATNEVTSTVMITIL